MVAGGAALSEALRLLREESDRESRERLRRGPGQAPPGELTEQGPAKGDMEVQGQGA